MKAEQARKIADQPSNNSPIGLEAGTASSDYIQLYDGKAETLAASLDRISESARRSSRPFNAPTTAWSQPDPI